MRDNGAEIAELGRALAARLAGRELEALPAVLEALALEGVRWSDRDRRPRCPTCGHLLRRGPRVGRWRGPVVLAPVGLGAARSVLAALREAESVGRESGE